MIVQGTVGIGKSYVISCIREVLTSSTSQTKSELLTLAPTRVVAFNIHALTIHARLKIPIKKM